MISWCKYTLYTKNKVQYAPIIPNSQNYGTSMTQIKRTMILMMSLKDQSSFSWAYK